MGKKTRAKTMNILIVELVKVDVMDAFDIEDYGSATELNGAIFRLRNLPSSAAYFSTAPLSFNVYAYLLQQSKTLDRIIGHNKWGALRRCGCTRV